MTVVQRRIPSNMATGDLSSVTARRAALSIESPRHAVAPAALSIYRHEDRVPRFVAR
jgi:hypothetical protein